MYVSTKKIGKANNIIKNQIIMTKEQPFYVAINGFNIIDFEKEPLEINSMFDFKLKNVNK